jgi:hypothetical protein
VKAFLFAIILVGSFTTFAAYTFSPAFAYSFRDFWSTQLADVENYLYYHWGMTPQQDLLIPVVALVVIAWFMLGLFAFGLKARISLHGTQ